MKSRIFVEITLVVIYLINSNECLFMSPKSGYLHPQYPYGIQKFKGINRHEEEIKSPVELENIKKDLTDKIQNVNVDEIKQKIPENIKQFFRNKIEEAPSENSKNKVLIKEEIAPKLIEPCVDKSIEEQVNVVNLVDATTDDKIIIPNVNLHEKQVAFKNNVKSFRNKLNKKINVKQMKHNVAVKLASVPKVKEIKYKIPKIKDRFAAKLKTIETCNLKTKAKTALSKLKAKKANVHVVSSIRQKYSNIKSSPSMQMYLNSLKTKVPKIKSKFNSLKAKVPKKSVKRSVPLLLTGGIVGQQIHHKRGQANKYDFYKTKKNFSRYMKSKGVILKKKQLNTKNYRININNRKSLRDRLRSYKVSRRSITYKRPSIFRKSRKFHVKGMKLKKAKRIGSAYIKENLLRHKDDLKVEEEKYLLKSLCGCGKSMSYSLLKNHKCKRVKLPKHKIYIF